MVASPVVEALDTALSRFVPKNFRAGSILFSLSLFGLSLACFR